MITPRRMLLFVIIYSVLRSSSSCPSAVNSRFFFCISLFCTCTWYCITLPGRYFTVTLRISHSAPAYLLLDKPSFTAPGSASLGIRLVDPCHCPSLLNRAVTLSEPSVKTAWKADTLSDQVTSFAFGYFTLKESVTAPGKERN